VCVHEIDHGWAELISSIEDGIFIIIACRPPLAFELPAHSTALPIPYELSDWEAALGTAQAFVNQSLHVQFSDDRICFQLTGAQYAFVESGKLMYVEADGQVSYAMLEDGTRLVVAHNIGYYKPVLLRQFQFMEISKSLMVNPRHIFRYSHRERALTLISGATLDASEQGARTLHKYVRQFHQVQQNGL
jgi:DNA-binding LytR/AlgR family response regulator